MLQILVCFVAPNGTDSKKTTTIVLFLNVFDLFDFFENDQAHSLPVKLNFLSCQITLNQLYDDNRPIPLSSYTLGNKSMHPVH